jgi:hypothetical protein
VPDNEKFEQFLQREVKDYNVPATPPPADAIWSKIEGDVAAAIDPIGVRRLKTRRTWITVGIGIAAALVIGVGLGRMSITTDNPRPQIANVPGTITAPDDSARMAAHAEASTM